MTNDWLSPRADHIMISMNTANHERARTKDQERIAEGPRRLVWGRREESVDNYNIQLLQQTSSYAAKR